METETEMKDTEQKTIAGYHFTGGTLRDGRDIPPIGEWMVHTGEITPCTSGLHMSKHPFDALTYAPGATLHRVELRGEIAEHGGDKLVGRERRIVATIDGEPVMREFARWCALQVIHLWEAPDVVKRYLETGDESIREEAQDAARATWATTWDAAGNAAGANAAGAARAAARDAARDAARAARDAAWAAAWAAWDAGDAARYATRYATREQQRDKFAEMVDEAFTHIK